MSRNGVKNIGDQIDSLIDAEKWEQARNLIEEALKKDPKSHWLLTQLGETFYEERDYSKALSTLLKSRQILPDCPLTLWHLAGTLDALKHHAEAVRIYTWLLRSNKTPEDDPCWESPEWTDALKTDCVYRLGLCFKHLKRNDLAEHCFRNYLQLLALGMKGSYPIADAKKHLPKTSSKRAEAENKLREAGWILYDSENGAETFGPPELDERILRQVQEA